MTARMIGTRQGHEAAHYITEREAKAQALALGDWSLRAACATAPIGLDAKGNKTTGTLQADRTRALFYTDLPGFRVESPKRTNHERMLRNLCGLCPALMECRELARYEPYGFLGGLSEVERANGKKVR